MDFGKVSEDLLDQINFKLPEGDASILSGLNGVGNVYVGMPRWGVTEWVGDVYPKGTPVKNFASQYVQQFNCIEFNATHYNVYKSERIQAWARIAESHNFKFCPKLFQGITYRSNIDQKEDLLQLAMLLIPVDWMIGFHA